MRSLDPRRSLAAGAMWLIIGLAATFSIAAAVWVGGIARANVSEQHIRRLSLETDQLSSDLGQALAGRLDAIRAAGRILQTAVPPERRGGLREVFSELTLAYPQFDWIAVADPQRYRSCPRAIRGSIGTQCRVERMVCRRDRKDPGSGSSSAPSARAGAPAPTARALGDMAAPVRDEAGRIVGVIAAHLSWRRAPYHPERLTDESNPATSGLRARPQRHGADRAGRSAQQAVERRSRRGRPGHARRAAARRSAHRNSSGFPDGRRVLVSRALLNAGPEIRAGRLASAAHRADRSGVSARPRRDLPDLLGFDVPRRRHRAARRARRAQAHRTASAAGRLGGLPSGRTNPSNWKFRRARMRSPSSPARLRRFWAIFARSAASCRL